MAVKGTNPSKLQRGAQEEFRGKTIAGQRGNQREFIAIQWKTRGGFMAAHRKNERRNHGDSEGKMRGKN